MGGRQPAAQQRGCVIRQGANGKAGKQAERSIEKTDDPAREIGRESIRGNGELRDDPLRARKSMGKNGGEELLQLLGEKQSRKK